MRSAPATWGRFHQHTCEAFSHKQDEKLFFGPKLREQHTEFGKNVSQFRLKFVALIVGEIE